MVTEPRRYWRRYARTMEYFWLVLFDKFGIYKPPAFPSPATIERPTNTDAAQAAKTLQPVR